MMLLKGDAPITEIHLHWLYKLNGILLRAVVMGMHQTHMHSLQCYFPGGVSMCVCMLCRVCVYDFQFKPKCRKRCETCGFHNRASESADCECNSSSHATSIEEMQEPVYESIPQ